MNAICSASLGRRAVELASEDLPQMATRWLQFRCRAAAIPPQLKACVGRSAAAADRSAARLLRRRSKPILCPAPLSCRDGRFGRDPDDPVRAALMDQKIAVAGWAHVADDMA